MMADSKRQVAKSEIDKSLFYTTRIMTAFGLSFELDLDMKTQRKHRNTFGTFAFLVCIHILSEIVHIFVTIVNSPRMEDVVPLFHTVGYSTISAARLFAIWFKKDMFSRLLHELVDIWPVPPLTEEVQQIKKQSLIALEIAHKLYFRLSMACDIFFNAQPILIYFYQVWQGQENPEVGYVWICWYPFDKHYWVAHIFVYCFEMLSGLNCVLAMVASDLLFTGMASHIGMLLRMLHTRLEALGSADEIQDQDVLYAEVVDSIKLHQRLTTYCNEMEETFSVVNLINVVLSSVIISCVVLVIVLLDPMISISNKLFLLMSLIQIGVVCWYSDDIFRANEHVAIAAYNSVWYKANARSRRALMLLILRSQKPIGFTAMKFTDLNLNTYSTILTRAYSYFTLLYTMFDEN